MTGNLKKADVRFCSLWFLLLMNIHCFGRTLSDFLNADGPPPKGAPPATPQGLKAVASSGQVTLAWNLQEGVNYDLFHVTNPKAVVGSGTKISSVNPPYTHTGLTNGTTYYYRLTANNSFGTSPPTEEVSATPSPPPAAPQNFMAAASDRRITLSWDSQAGLTYDLFYSTSSGIDVDSDTVMKISGITPPHTHEGLTNGTTYYYRLTAANPSGTSPPTEEVSATPAPVPPLTPQNFAAIALNQKVRLSWDERAGVTYNLFHSVIAGIDVGSSTVMKISNVMPPHTHVGLTNGTTYYYRLTAVNLSGTSPPAEEVSATPSPPTCGT